jgi:simple sugar transport system permease protein
MLVGADKMQRTMQVPSALVVALNGLIVLFVVSSDIFVRRRSRKRVSMESDMSGGETVHLGQEVLGD